MSTTTQSLSLRALLKSAVRRAGLADRAPRVYGVTPPVLALASAATTEGGLLLVVPTDRDLEQVVADARLFLAALEGLSEADAERAVLPFPSQEVDPYRGLAPHFDVASARARVLHALATGNARLVVASARALMSRVSRPDRLARASIELAPGDDLSPIALADLLGDAGFTREDPVDEHGEFCVRGGVVDLFPPGERGPVRIEFIGDTVESIRRFDPATQRSVETVSRVSVVPVREAYDLLDADPPGAGAAGTAGAVDSGLAGRGAAFPEPDRSATVFDYVRRHGRLSVALAEPEAVDERGRAFESQLRASHADTLRRGERAPRPEALIVPWDEVLHALAGAARYEQLGFDEAGEAGPAAAGRDAASDQRGSGGPHGGRARHVACQPTPEFRGRLPEWVADLRRARAAGDSVLFFVGSSGRLERTIELLREYELTGVDLDHAESTAGATVLLARGRLSRGFRLPDAALQVYAETDVFEEERVGQDRRRAAAATFLSDFRDLAVGDLVVHVDHGIGVFVGLRRIAVGVETQEFMELRYAGDDKLFVPVERLDLVQKYSGAARPPLERLGGTSWEKAKTRVKKAMRDMADELLRLYAARRAVQGHAFSRDTHWQEEFESAFEYDLTPDQQTAIAAIKADMEAPSPMDRLLCGDVGYGKTEVAMRAAFKAVLDGKQVALLAPTTVLAMQHLRTLTSRFAAFPVKIDMVSRFRTRAEQKATLASLAEGRVDIIVGTHRLLSKDVVFHDLGLLVVDEEQRFGVAHKERLKQMRKKVDVLTMSATPIPRTLNMSLVGIRDMSVIETPPRDRLAIQTQVVKFDQRVIASAVRNEIERGGQVYFVHNRVESIHSVANLLTRLVPEARVAVGHGQLSEDALERVMVDFVSRQADVLVATTIIENGLDIPNANTMIVNRADRYGLAQLYQLRGRVGRSDRRAYAYLLVPPGEVLSGVARKRLAAIREFSDLGSGFRVAALDLEIRGAGNLLGGQQSGHIEAIGFEMYMKLLDETVRELKGESLEDEARASINLKVQLRIDEQYIPDVNQRLGIYRRLASARAAAPLDAVLEEVRDRYGPLPHTVLVLAAHARVRLLADCLRVESIDREGPLVVIKFRPDAPLDPTWLIGLLSRRSDLQLVPPVSLRLDTRQPAAAPRRPLRGAPVARGGPIARPSDAGPGSSWWAARARAGVVAPGFTREAILRPEAEDPLAPGGIFERVGSLLEELDGSLGRA
jgi:transcription-repair coupling factor (superfamily II helicase)